MPAFDSDAISLPMYRQSFLSSESVLSTTNSAPDSFSSFSSNSCFSDFSLIIFVLTLNLKSLSKGLFLMANPCKFSIFEYFLRNSSFVSKSKWSVLPSAESPSVSQSVYGNTSLHISVHSSCPKLLEYFFVRSTAENL